MFSMCLKFLSFFFATNRPKGTDEVIHKLFLHKVLKKIIREFVAIFYSTQNDQSF